MKIDFEYLKEKLTDPKILLILILILGLFLRMYFFVGVNRSDTPLYLHSANRVLNGEFYLGSFIGKTRIMMIYPIAFFFFLFGINELSAALYPLLTSLGSILVIFYIGRLLFNKKVGLLAAFFLSIFPLNIVFSTWPMPDVPVAFFSALSILLFLKAELGAEKNTRKIFLLLSGVFVGIGYLTKVSGLIPLLFIVPYILYKIIKKREIDFNYGLLFLGFILILFVEGLFYLNFTGNFFQRYETVSSTYAVGKNTNLEIYPIRMFNLNNNLSFNWSNLYFVPYGLFYFFIFPSFAYITIKRNKKALIPLFWFFLFFSYLEFGTMNIHEYVPIHRLPRHLTLVTIPGILCLSHFLVDIQKGASFDKLKKVSVFLIISFLFATSIFYTHNKVRYLDSRILDTKKIYQFSKKYPEKNIYAHEGTLSFLRFYYDFHNKENLKDLTSVKNRSKVRDSFVVVNGTRGVIENSQIRERLPSFAKNPPENWELVKNISGPKIGIWGNYNPKIYYVPE